MQYIFWGAYSGNYPIPLTRDVKLMARGPDESCASHAHPQFSEGEKPLTPLPLTVKKPYLSVGAKYNVVVLESQQQVKFLS